MAVKETRFRESKLCNVHAELAHWNLWAFTLPLWAYVLVGFCPMGFCPDTVRFRHQESKDWNQ